MQDESAIEERMDFTTLSSAIKPAVTMKACISRPSMEEQELWDNSTFSNKIFNAGIDHTAAAAEERKRLEQEATNFDLWNGADFVPEDPNDGELLLDELEQGDILTELLRSTRKYISQFHSYTFQCISCFRIDVNVPEGADLVLDEEVQGRPKTSEAWSPYESKMVSQPFNTQTEIS